MTKEEFNDAWRLAIAFTRAAIDHDQAQCDIIQYQFTSDVAAASAFATLASYAFSNIEDGEAILDCMALTAAGDDGDWPL